ncbi:MAG: hypothetical protein GY851_10380 [bacterium]|nr:hypothetical protein [bacterium]
MSDTERPSPTPSFAARLGRFALKTVAACAAVALFARPVPVWAPIAVLIVTSVALWRLRQRDHVSSGGCRTAFANTALFIGASLFALGLLEGAARLLLPAEPSTQADYLEPHPEYEYTLLPGGRETVDRREAPNTDRIHFTVEISLQGLRNKALGPKGPGEFRVLVVGDSFAMGYGVKEDETIAAHLEETLRRAGAKRITVINGGVMGYGPWQEHGFLLERGLALEPDLVVVQTFPTNDFYDSLAKEGRFFHAYSEVQLARRNEYLHQGFWPVRAQRWLRKHSRTYQALARMTGRDDLVVAALGGVRGTPRFTPLAPPPSADRAYAAEASLKEWYPEIEDGARLFGEDLGAMCETCRQRDIGFVVLCVPGLHVLHDATWRAYTVEYGAEHYDRGRDLREAEALLANASIPYVSVLDAFEAYGYPLELYFTYDMHLRPRGCRLVAGLLAQYLISEGLLTDADSSALPSFHAPARGNLIRNGGFTDWLAEAPCPVGWRWDTDRPEPNRHYVVTKEVGDTGGVVLTQAWRSSDSADGLNRLFGQTIERLKPNTEYHLTVRAWNRSDRPVAIAAHEVDEKGGHVATLKLTAAEVLPSEGFVEHTGTFFTGTGSRVRLVAYYPRPEEGPITVGWDKWRLWELD